MQDKVKKEFAESVENVVLVPSYEWQDKWLEVSFEDILEENNKNIFVEEAVNNLFDGDSSNNVVEEKALPVDGSVTIDEEILDKVELSVKFLEKLKNIRGSTDSAKSRKGDLGEGFVVALLNSQQDTAKVWAGREALKANGFIDKALEYGDGGLDIVRERTDGTYDLFQVKTWSSQPADTDGVRMLRSALIRFQKYFPTAIARAYGVSLLSGWTSNAKEDASLDDKITLLVTYNHVYGALTEIQAGKPVSFLKTKPADVAPKTSYLSATSIESMPSNTPDITKTAHKSDTLSVFQSLITSHTLELTPDIAKTKFSKKHIIFADIAINKALLCLLAADQAKSTNTLAADELIRNPPEEVGTIDLIELHLYRSKLRFRDALAIAKKHNLDCGRELLQMFKSTQLKLKADLAAAAEKVDNAI